jgi:hypothetical protein
MLDPTKAYIEGDFFDVETAISQLLVESVLFANYRNYTHDDKNFTKDGRTIILFMNCSDVFAWGCADAEDISSEEELKQLYDFCVKYPTWGSTIWACLKRNEKPQSPVEKKMKDCNEWPKELDSLLENKYDTFLNAATKAKAQYE